IAESDPVAPAPLTIHLMQKDVGQRRRNHSPAAFPCFVRLMKVAALPSLLVGLTMLKQRLLALRPADSPRRPADSRRLCHPASAAPVAQRRRGPGYRVSESLPELIPFNQQVHQVLSDAPPRPPGFSAILPSQAGKSKPAGRLSPPPPWSGPGVSAQVASLQSL